MVALKQGYRKSELEEIIATDAWASCNYTKDFLLRRWIPGEEAIATDNGYSLYYARYAIKGRFKLGEPVIFNSTTAATYINEFITDENEKTYLRLKYC